MEKLTPQELREFAVWFEDRQALLNSSEGLFRFYDEEEKHAQADEESLPGRDIGGCAVRASG